MRRRICRLVARTSAALLIAALASGCGDECDAFYSTYEGCGFGVAEDDVCDGLTEDETCAQAFELLNACAANLEEECGYPDECPEYVLNVSASCF